MAEPPRLTETPGFWEALQIVLRFGYVAVVVYAAVRFGETRQGYWGGFLGGALPGLLFYVLPNR